MITRVLIWLVLLSCYEGVSVAQADLPEGFSEERVASGLDLPTAIVYAPDGRLFIAEKAGVVRVVDPAGKLLADAFITLEDEINNGGDRGLMGIELDPNFLENGYVYLFYAVDPEYGQPDESAYMPTFSRLTRYTASPESNRNVADLESRMVLIGEDAATGIPICYTSHMGGGLRFAADGTLFLSTGDGASSDYIDYGQNVAQSAEQCEALFPTQDLGAFRAQSLESLSGKIVRIDPQTGEGLPSNPFYDGDPDSIPSRLWAIGFRNPFRFSIDPNSGAPGTLYVGDVGWWMYEELDRVYPGDNMGWPCWEGSKPQYAYQEDAIAGPICAAEAPIEVVDFPFLAWSHSEPESMGFTGASVTGGDFYTGTAYPSQYQGSFFFMDYVESWGRSVMVGDGVTSAQSTAFATQWDGPVAMRTDPRDGNLVYVSINTGEVRKIQYGQTAHLPVAVATVTPTSGTAPLTVDFDATGSYDEDGDALVYLWDLGNGESASQAAFSYTYQAGGTYFVTLTVTDVSGRFALSTFTVAVDNTPPTAHIRSPIDGSSVDAPSTVALLADAQDAEDALLPESAYHWTINLHHDTHVHYDWIVTDGSETSFPVESPGDTGTYIYEITVRVEDSGGLVDEDVVTVFAIAASDSEDPADDDGGDAGDGASDDAEVDTSDPSDPDSDGSGESDGGTPCDECETPEPVEGPVPDNDDTSDGVATGDPASDEGEVVQPSDASTNATGCSLLL